MFLCSTSRLWWYLSMILLQLNFKRLISSCSGQVKTLFCPKVLPLCHICPPYLPGIFCKCQPTAPLIFSLSGIYPFPAPTKLKSLCLYLFCFSWKISSILAAFLASFLWRMILNAILYYLLDTSEYSCVLVDSESSEYQSNQVLHYTYGLSPCTASSVFQGEGGEECLLLARGNLSTSRAVTTLSIHIL